MPRNWYSIKAVADAPAVITIYDEIGMWGVTAKDFIAAFRAIEAQDVTLEINTPGGSVFDGLAMFNAMKTSGKNITVVVMGIAASMGSYLAMVGSKIVMPENTFMMVHNPLNSMYGNADDMREMADILDKIGASLTATYVARTGKTEQEIADLLAAESYLTAAECLALGLCDEVTPAITAVAKFETDRLPDNIKALLTPVLPVAVVITFADQVVAAAAAAQMPQFAASWAVSFDTLDKVHARISEVAEIRALCTVVKADDKAEAFVAAGKSLSDVRADLCAALALSDKPVDTTQKICNDPSLGVQPSAALNPKAIWAARQNQKGVKK